MGMQFPGARLVFCGGRSQSKAYRLIERMSEDVDLKIVLDESHPSSASAQKRNISQLRAEVYGFLAFSAVPGACAPGTAEISQFLCEGHSQCAHGPPAIPLHVARPLRVFWLANYHTHVCRPIAARVHLSRLVFFKHLQRLVLMISAEVKTHLISIRHLASPVTHSLI